MGLPAKLISALDSLSTEGPAAPPEPLSQEEPRPPLDFAHGRLAQATMTLHRHLDSLEALNRSAGDSVAVYLEEARRSSPSDGFNFDEGVDALEEWERKLRETFLPDLRHAEKDRREATSLPPKYRAQAIQTANRRIKIFSEVLKSIRDARWQLMAIRAEREDPGDSPVFSDPDALLQYLHAK